MSAGAALTLAVVLSACSNPGSTHEPRPPIEAYGAAYSTDFRVPTVASKRWDLSLDLTNTSDSAVVLDAVTLSALPNLPNIRLVDVRVIPHPSHSLDVDAYDLDVDAVPLDGYRLKPTADDELEPLLAVEVSRGHGPLSANGTVDVAYHDASDERFVARFVWQYYFCDGNFLTGDGCNRAYASIEDLSDQPIEDRVAYPPPPPN